MTKIIFLWFFVAMCFYFVGTYLSKMYSENPSLSLFISSVFLFMIVSCCWMPAIRESKQLATFGSLWSIVCIMIEIFIGAVLFKEHIEPIKWVGIGTGAISVILLSL